MLPTISGNAVSGVASFAHHPFSPLAQQRAAARRLVQCAFLPVQDTLNSDHWQEGLVTLHDLNDQNHLRTTLTLGSSVNSSWVREDAWSEWVQLDVVLTETSDRLDLRRFARAARRVHPDLLGASLYVLEELCRFTRPLLTPHAAFSGLHEQVHGDWADLLEIDTTSRSERAVDRLIRAQGLHAAGDAGRLYDASACHHGPPLDVQLQALPASRVTEALERLQDLRERARPWLGVLERHLDDGCAEMAFASHTVTRNARHDHLADLRDHLDSLESECAVYAARFALSPAGGRTLKRVMQAVNELSALSAQGVRLLADL